MPAVALLGQLNEIDLAIDALRARASEIAEALKEPAALQAARSTATAADAELARCKAVQAERESSQQKASARLTQAEERLYGGKVRNPKELEDAEKDVAELRRQQSPRRRRFAGSLDRVKKPPKPMPCASADLRRLTHRCGRRPRPVCRAEQARVTERLTAERTCRPRPAAPCR